VNAIRIQTKVLDVTLGAERRNKLDVCILGDDVSKLKPDPMIYVTASERLQIDPSKCVVIEDSMVGLRAAKGAVSVEFIQAKYVYSFINRSNIYQLLKLYN
jgi:beta-phosphoglucomutase-like phosphatase (HAD superfamily)